MPILSQAAVGFSGMTSASGTSEQIWQMSSAGVTAGLASGNFYMDSPPANIINGVPFAVTVAGWVKAHGTSQTIKFGLMWQAWNGSSRSGSPADAFTTVASGTLTAGTVYDFYVQQKFLGDANAQVLSPLGLPTVVVGGTAVTISAVTSPLTTFNFATASQTEPITGINASYNYPAVSFVPSFLNSVSDTTETLQLTTFNLSALP
jgi:hypothetical protein